MKNITKLSKKSLFYILILIIAIYLMFPFYWAINTSFKDQNQIAMTPATFIPKDIETGKIRFSIKNYLYVFTNEDFGKGLLNSFFVASTVTLLAIIFGSFAAYAFGKLRFRGKKVGLYFVLALTLFPQITLLTGLYKIVSTLKMHAYINLIFAYMIFSLPFTIWVLTSFTRSIPNSLIESAKIDGAKTLHIIFFVFFPLLAPALVTTSLLAFIAAWNEYLFALVFTLTDAKAQTIPVVIAQFAGKYTRLEPYGEIMAAAVLVSIPLIILVLIFQNKIIAGLTAGAEKG